MNWDSLVTSQANVISMTTFGNHLWGQGVTGFLNPLAVLMKSQPFKFLMFFEDNYYLFLCISNEFYLNFQNCSINFLGIIK